jgi:hypothetical protein
LSKGAEWSKYRETKGNLYSISNVPGPGSYNNGKRSSSRRYLEKIEDKSWQFKSLTRRESFMNKMEQKMYEVIPSRNRFDSDIDQRHKASIPLLINHKSEDAIDH